jgi:phosphopentomutase
MGEWLSRRVFVLVIDAFGVGALPDASDYGDEGTNTLVHLAQALDGLELPTLQELGLGSIVAVSGVPASVDPAIHGRLHALGAGKDSITGHWELMGVVSERALPTYPHGFPPDVLALLERAIGRELICNRPDNGLAAIEEFGGEHLRTGALIVYTSQDSVLQLAAHVERVSEAELYAACTAARAAMSGEHQVGRVIARPFTGREGAFARTSGRRDYALEPPGRSYLQELQDDGVEVHAVGKVDDLFAGVGISQAHAGPTNALALQAVERLMAGLESGLVLANLIETDQVYGHRKDMDGFAGALRAIDARVGAMLEHMRDGDLLIVTADHGVDMTHPGTDHTREYAPLLALSGAMLARRAGGGGLRGARHDGPLADVGATALGWLTGREARSLPGDSFIS